MAGETLHRDSGEPHDDTLTDPQLLASATAEARAAVEQFKKDSGVVQKACFTR